MLPSKRPLPKPVPTGLLVQVVAVADEAERDELAPRVAT
jgi:hypothetical protein